MRRECSSRPALHPAVKSVTIATDRSTAAHGSLGSSRGPNRMLVLRDTRGPPPLQ